MAMTVIYRIIRGAQPSREDFLSDEESGKLPRDETREKLRRHRGFSIWLTERNARAIARRFPQLGSHIVEVRLPSGALLEPFDRTPDHNTAYGDSDDFLGQVVRVVSVR